MQQLTKLENKFNHGQNVVVEKFIPTIDNIAGYHIWVMFIMLFDLITYFINKTEALTNITPNSNLYIAIFIMISQLVDLFIVAVYGISRKIRWFTTSYILYAASSISTAVALILFFGIGDTFDNAFSWQVGFLSIFRGQVRSVVIRRQNQSRLQKALRKSTNLYIVSYLIYVTRVIRVIFQSLYGILIFIFVFMGSVFLNERALDSKRSFIELLYFITVTMSTVGYGDITLDGGSGRIITIIFIVVALIYIPVAIGVAIQKLSNELPRLKLLRQIYGGVIVIGQKDIQLASSVRAVFPQQQSISVLMTDINQNYDDHPDMKAFIEGVPSMQFMISDSYDTLTLKQMQLDNSLIVLVYSDSKISASEMQQSDGLAIVQAVCAAQSLQHDNILVVILQIESSVVICKEKLYQYLNEDQCIVYSLSKTYSHIIYLSCLYSGFSTFFTNALIPSQCQLNQFNTDKQKFALKNLNQFTKCCTKADHEVVISQTWDLYNSSCGKKDYIGKIIENATSKPSQDVQQTVKDLLVVVCGEINKELLISTLSLLRKFGSKLYIILDNNDFIHYSEDDIIIEGNIFDEQFYLQNNKEVLVFMEDNDGKEVLIEHALQQSSMEHNICVMESLIEIQSKFEIYRKQKYIPCGLSCLCTLILRNPITFQNFDSFIQNHHNFKQYLLQESLCVEDWENKNKSQIVIYINREGFIINIYDKQLQLQESDIITTICLQ
ncbi:Ion transport 2 and transmembrane domain-containing protein [Spironucleus salmonicida]|uniref:Ion transport 2 and transmembrane domain-containing protein n=1 Tax=Spironucleus salmonicida TaxID=348837 RepID=V6LLU6_9EUKA|nr:Ion transport 2 and transmembrane domain-containing protein [Spironucleus salmonicida]|eukprot:EST41669.1 Ion transport 2 and transmembrane domain-containing protein [Spironucleus salmonicida]